MSEDRMIWAERLSSLYEAQEDVIASVAKDGADEVSIALGILCHLLDERDKEIDALEKRIDTLEKNEKINAEWYAKHNESIMKILSNITKVLGEKNDS